MARNPMLLDQYECTITQWRWLLSTIGFWRKYAKVLVARYFSIAHLAYSPFVGQVGAVGSPQQSFAGFLGSGESDSSRARWTGRDSDTSLEIGRPQLAIALALGPF